LVVVAGEGVRVVLAVIDTGMNLVVVLTASFVVVAVAFLVLFLVFVFVVAFVAVLVVFLVFVTVCVLVLVLAFVVALVVVVLVVLVVVVMIVLVSVTVAGVTRTPGMTAVMEEEGVKVALRVSKSGRYPSIPACSRVRSLPQYSSCRLHASMMKFWSGSLRMMSAPLMSFVHLAPLFACPAKGDLSDVAYGVQEPSKLVAAKLR
jgi:ABC-type transport system involved in multi-copper enzyme maturation permease subunit